MATIIQLRTQADFNVYEHLLQANSLCREMLPRNTSLGTFLRASRRGNKQQFMSGLRVTAAIFLTTINTSPRNVVRIYNS